MPNFSSMECHKDFIVCKEGEEANKVFIIVSGEFQVSKKSVNQIKKRENLKDIV